MWGGGGGSPSIPLIILKKISHIPNRNMANISKNQKALYPHITKIDPSIPYPFKYLQNTPYSFTFLANIPVSLKTLPGLHCRNVSKDKIMHKTDGSE